MFADRLTARVVMACFCVTVLEGFDIQALGVAAPAIAPVFGLTPLKMGWLFSISNIGILVGAVGGGRAGDIWGRRRILTLAVLTFALGTLGVALADGYAAFFLARLLSGVGFGAALPNISALAVEVSAPQQRARTAAGMFCGMPLGGALVALLSQALPIGSSWRVLFLVGGVLPLLLVYVLHRVLPETRGKAVATAPAMPVREALFGGNRMATTLLLWVTFLPTLLSLYLLLNWLPMLMVQKGFSKALAPMAVLVFNSPSVIGTLIIGSLVDRYGARRIIVPSFLLLAVTLTLLSMASGFSTVLLLLGVAGFLLLSANYALYGIAAQQYPLAGQIGRAHV